MRVAQTDKTQTVINGVTLTAQQKAEFVRMYGTPPLAGSFWYDTRSGLWGVNGREAFGVLRPGHDYGQLSPTASRGTTGVFINGRQINMAEALYIRNLLGAVAAGRSGGSMVRPDISASRAARSPRAICISRRAPRRRAAVAAARTTTTTAWARRSPRAPDVRRDRRASAAAAWTSSSAATRLTSRRFVNDPVDEGSGCDRSVCGACAVAWRAVAVVSDAGSAANG